MRRGSVIPLTDFIRLVQEVDPELFCSYLENTGWELGLKGIVFRAYEFHDDGNNSEIIIVPMHRDAEDYVYGMSEALKTVSDVTGISLDELLRLLTSGYNKKQ